MRSRKSLSRDGTAALKHSPEPAAVLRVSCGHCNFCERPYPGKMQRLKMDSAKKENLSPGGSPFPSQGDRRCEHDSVRASYKPVPVVRFSCLPLVEKNTCTLNERFSCSYVTGGKGGICRKWRQEW